MRSATGIFMASVLLAGCSPVGGSSSSAPSVAQNSPLQTPPSTPSSGNNGGTSQPGAGSSVPKLGLCSDLNLTGITWSKDLPGDQREMLALALNITGSFEGNGGWATLSDNFDGQGLSMGILNQNFGQGTLQPMWVEMHSRNPAAMKASFSAANYKSLLTMLGTWKGTVFSSSTFRLRDYGYSELDDPAIVAQELGIDPSVMQEVVTAAASKNAASVSWAVKTIYTKGDFKTDWEKQLKALANTADYRSIQVAESEGLHQLALSLMTTFKLSQLRSYLFLFDLVVQNGGASSTMKTRYKSWLLGNPKATETQKLNELLALKLPSVSKQYQADVKARKTALINGKGTVHSTSRMFEKEYCVDFEQILL